MSHALLDDFTQYMGLDSLPLDDNGEALLVFDNRLPVLIRFDFDQGLLTFDAELGRASGQRNLVMQTLLEAASQWRELDVWFSIEPDSRSFHIHRRTRLADFPALQQSLESFVEAADGWQQLITASASVEQEQPSTVDQKPTAGVRV